MTGKLVQYVNSHWPTFNGKKVSCRHFAQTLCISHPSLISVLDGRQPGLKVCLALAKYFTLPVYTILHMAGHVETEVDNPYLPLVSDLVNSHPEFYKFMEWAATAEPKQVDLVLRIVQAVVDE